MLSQESPVAPRWRMRVSGMDSGAPSECKSDRVGTSAFARRAFLTGCNAEFGVGAPSRIVVMVGARVRARTPAAVVGQRSRGL